MDVRQAFKTALRNLGANRLRFAQTLLGLMVGAAAVVVILSTGQGMLQYVDEGMQEAQFNNIFMALNTRVEYGQKVTLADMEQVAADNPGVIQAITPWVNMMFGGVKYGDEVCGSAQLVGVSERLPEVFVEVQLAEGQFFQYMDVARERNVCVVGDDIANRLMGGNALGQSLRIYGSNYTVVGVMERQAASDEFDGMVYIPYTNAQAIAGDVIVEGWMSYEYYNNVFYVRANGLENVANARLAVQSAMEEKLGPLNETWSFLCTSVRWMSEQMKNTVYLWMTDYTAGSLFVILLGGIGVMNVMLAAVSARRPEIGVRKAYGATKRDIRRQFLLEAVITSLTGGLLGVAVGTAISRFAPSLLNGLNPGYGLVVHVSRDYCSVSLVAVVLALLFTLLIGIIFGTYPANEAAKMEPVEAINSI